LEKVRKKVLILGSTGMLGHKVYHVFKTNHQFIVFDIVYRKTLHKQSIVCDVTDKYKLEGIIKDIQPDIIVNCIGILIKGSSSNPANAIYINAFLPHFLSSVARDLNCKFIHISTDCVFSGNKGGYLESDFRDADDIYGRSKALGELNNQHDLTIRTSIIGPEIKQQGEGLLHWFLNQEGSVNGFTNAFWGGVTTQVLSKAIVAAVDQDISGLIHLTNGEPISKYELLQLFKQAFLRASLKVNPFEGKEVDKSLRTERNDFDFSVPSYSKMISDMKLDMAVNKHQYNLVYSF
jgi:dTDP-4-dehydrorhamnose reductase